MSARMRLILFSLQIDESSISFTIDHVIVRVSPLDPGKFNGNAKKRLTLGSLEADQLGILAFPGAVKRPHPGIVQRVEMQSVHGADRFSTAVHLLIKHTTINSAGYFLFGCFQLSSSPNDSNSLDAYIYKCTTDRKHRSSFQKIEIYPEFTATSVVQFQQVSLDGGPPLTGTPNDSVARWWLPGDCHAVVLRAALFRYQYRRSRG